MLAAAYGWPAQTGDVTLYSTRDKNGATTDTMGPSSPPDRSKRTWAYVRAGFRARVGYLLPLAAEHVTRNFSSGSFVGSQLATCGRVGSEGARVGCALKSYVLLLHGPR